MRADDNDRRVPLSALARRYRHFLLDLDGCLYVGDAPTERATEALAALREASKGIVFLTNEVGSSPEEIVRKLWRLGLPGLARRGDDGRRGAAVHARGPPGRRRRVT